MIIKPPFSLEVLIAIIFSSIPDNKQAVIEANLIAPLVNLLQNAEFDIKKEAAWAISNATSGGSHEQIKYGEALVFNILKEVNMIS